jgi:chaperonin GroEL
MASKQVIYDEDVRKALKRGVDAVANTVRLTMGPRGRNVALDKGYGGPTVTNDGVSIAKEISLKDKFENMGAEIVKEVATMNVRRGIDVAVQDIVAELKDMAQPVKSNEEIKQVATVSAESEELGTVIAETIEKVGKDGVVTVEEGQSFAIESEVVEGMQFDKGYASPYMVTNAERMEAEYKDVAVLVTDKKISAIKDILPLLEKLAQSGKKDLVIIAEDVEGEALATFVVNKLRGTFNVLCVKAPGYGEKKKDMLTDIALTVGAEVITEDLGRSLEKAEVAQLGTAGRVVATKDTTTIVDGKGNKADIDARVAALKQQADNTDSSFDREKLEERIAKLAGGVAVVRVGAATETEMKYLKLKIEDAVNATKAAIEEGIVPGGGSALAKVAHKLAEKQEKEDKSAHRNDVEFATGYAIMLTALKMPLYRIAYNAGRDDDASVIVEKVATDSSNTGFDAKTGEMVDMIKEGIVDPVKVARSGVQNAASAAAILLTTEAAVAEAPEDEKTMPDMGGMGGMGGGMPGMGMM